MSKPLSLVIQDFVIRAHPLDPLYVSKRFSVCVTPGVPQGFVLGPASFSIVADSFKCHSGNVIAVNYAADFPKICGPCD